MDSSTQKFVVIGNGAAGIQAAATIREHHPNCEILLLTNEHYLSYYRPMLTKSLVQLPSLETFFVHDEAWYQQNRIKTQTETQVTRLDTAKKMIYLSDATSLRYDKCIYALGAESFLPPLNGIDKKGVYAIRKLTDLWAIRQELPDIKRVIIVGGGVLGLEAAWEFSKSGCQITILERGQTLMSRQLDPECSKLLGQIIETHQITIQYGADTQEITGTQQADGILLKSGEHLPADLILFSTGVTANISVAKASGLSVSRGVIVNEYLETSAPDVYACGDCAEYLGVSYKLLTEASAMGKVAGANSCGAKIKYELPSPPLFYSGMGTSLFAIGANGQDPTKQYQVIRRLNEKTQRYEAYYFENNCLAGVIMLGDISKFVALEKAVQTHLPYEQLNLD